MTKSQSLTALTEFIEDPDLAELEARGLSFNVFDALGLAHRERTHSDMLAWLCDPGASHGLGDQFTRLLVRHVAREAGGAGGAPTLFEVDGWDLSGAEVRREWRHIDLLVLDESLGFALVVENKVWSSEHSGQLARYRATVSAELKAYDRRLFVYLTPDRSEPSHRDYVPLGYTELADMVGALRDSRRSNSSADVLTFIDHYQQTILNHITGESEIAEICRTIYRNHRQAITLIMEHVPDLLPEISESLQRIIEGDPDLIADKSTTSLIRFIPKELDSIPKVSTGWTPSGRILLFELRNTKGSDPRVQLYLGPGESSVRELLFARAIEHRDLFRSLKRDIPSPEYQRFFSDVLFSRDEMVGLSQEELDATLHEVVESIKRDYVAPTVAALSGVEW